MNKLIVFFCLLGAALAAQKSYAGSKVYNVFINSDDQYANLRSLQIQYSPGFDFWDSFHRTDKSARIMVHPEFIVGFEEFLSSNGFAYEVIMNNPEAVFEAERQSNDLARARAAARKVEGKSTVEFTHFWTNAEIDAYLDEIAAEYPDIATVEIVGQSFEGRDIRAVHISLGGGLVDNSKPIILIDSNIHAREWIAGMVGVHLIHELVEHSDENLDILESVDWVIVPMANPDGYEYSQTTERMWRKTRQPNAGSTCVGVDPNRNFDFQWDVSGGASTSACSEAYRGTAPETESEVRAIAALMQRWSNTQIYISVHSYGNWLLYPWGYAVNNYISNWEDHEELGKAVTGAIYAVSGTNYTLGNSAALLYIASGASDDFAAGGGTAGMAFTLELPGGGSQGFDIPPARITAVQEETFPAFREWGKYVATRWGQ